MPAVSSSWLGPWAEVGRVLAQGFGQLLYPNTCWFCNQLLLHHKSGFCELCREELIRDPYPSCPRCAGTIGPYTNLEGGCPSCRGVSFAFDEVLRLGPYVGKLREVVLRLKHGGGEGLAEAIGELWTDHAEDRLRALGADVIIPIPLHWRRYFWRGYNQSEALARCLAARLNLPCRPRWLRRIRATPRQNQQPASTRLPNVRGAFAASGSLPLKSKTILIVDDVLTTGSTASEAARALRPLKPARIVVAVLARGRGAT